MLNNKPPRGRVNLFHHLFIPPSLNPSKFLLPLYCASLECQDLPWLFEHRERLRKAAKNSPRTLSPHTLVIGVISSGGSARLASSLSLPLSPGMFPSPPAPRGEAQVEPGGASVQPACNRSTHPGFPSCHVERLLG